MDRTKITDSYNNNIDSTIIIDLTRSYTLSCIKNSFNNNTNCKMVFICSNGHKIELGGKLDRDNVSLSSDIELRDGLECYFVGKNNDAIKHFQAAERYGNVDALNLIGVCYIKAIGVEEDYSKAIVWFKKAAQRGNLPAMANLAYCYEEGKGGVKKDTKKVEKYYKMIALHGDLGGIFCLGSFYYRNGNRRKAIELLELAADQGYKAANAALEYIDMLDDGFCPDSVMSSIGLTNTHLEDIFLPKYCVVGEK